MKVMRLHITNEDFRRMRSVYRLSMMEWGDLLGISDAYVNQIEKSQRRLTENVVNQLVKELELTEEKLLRILDIYNEFQRSEKLCMRKRN
jgi:predicted transcriptional regulator